MASPTVDEENWEARFLDLLPVIDRLINAAGRRYGWSADEIEEFGAWARARLVLNDYLALRQFRGEGSLRTFLVPVITNLLRDYRNSRWGRWRPSALAKRLGPDAVRLETLISRDRIPTDQAVATVAGPAPAKARLQGLRALAARLPRRVWRREVPIDHVTLPGPDDPHAEVLISEAFARRKHLVAELTVLLRELTPEEQTIVKMRYWDGFRVSEIARTLRLDQKRLYRRLEAIQNRLRRRLLEEGVTRRDCREILVAGD